MSAKREPEFDRDGYPTAKTLRTIEKWNCVGRQAKLDLLDYVRKAWYAPNYFTIEDGEYHISTAGWSGNEDLIGAMRGNFLFWSMCWVQSRRGGHYIFEVEDADSDLTPATPCAANADAASVARKGE
jgi:hypothetical protein